MYSLRKIKDIDNKLYLIAGYRQSVNIVVIGVAFFAYYFGQYETSAIIFLLGLKWLISQAYHNIDALEVMDRMDRKIP